MPNQNVVNTLEAREGHVTWTTGQGSEACGTVVRLTRYAVAFEIDDPAVVLQASEVLEKFQMFIGDRAIYNGRAVVTGLVQTGLVLLCEAKLDEEAAEAGLASAAETCASLEQDCELFFRQWQTNYRISPEFKVLVADVEAFLVGVGQWLDQLEFCTGTRRDRLLPEQERELLEKVGSRVIGTFNSQHERFEEMIYAVPEEFRGAHESFVRHHWQKLFLCTPFGNRTYYKPLGYAGDYEMMNMIHRNQPEGSSLYRKLIHLLLVSQWPAQSVRNRISHLKENIFREAVRVSRWNRPCRILNIGCGPAWEIQDFLRQTSAQPEAEITLVDFNEETLAHVRSRLAELIGRSGWRGRVETRRLSVYQLLRQGSQAGDGVLEENYDLIYCAGLFDYLSDVTCRSLVGLFYNCLLPGGLMVVANMKDDKPFRNFIEFVLDWHLIYRDSRRLDGFAPKRARETARVEAEPTSVNLFLHARKPE